MSRKDMLSKKFDKVERIIKFYQSLLIAILGGLVWSIYAIMEDKATEKIVILSFVGIVIFIFIILKIKSLDVKEDDILKELESIEE